MRKLLVTLALLAAFAVVLDRVALLVAERVLADRIEAVEALGSRPAVAISGFPFLTQALTGDYRQIVVRAENLRRGQVPMKLLTARLSGVQVGLSRLLRGSLRRVRVRSAQVQILIRYSALDGLLAPLQVSYGGSAGTVELRIGRLGPRALARLQVKASVLRGEIEQVPTLSAQRAAGFELRLRLPALPFGVSFDGVSSSPQFVRLSAAGSQLLLTPVAG
ncbi:MAG: LmeA family phospholipid-binding protein [Mycobacteriales bacterium]